MSKRDRPLRILVVSSQSSDSGSNLRGRYLAKALAKAGAQVRFINGVKAMPWMLDYLVSFVIYSRIIFIRCDVLIGLKPFPNITLLMIIKKWLGCYTVIDIDDLDFGYRAGILGHLNHWLQCPFPRFFSLTTYHIGRLRPVILNTFKVKETRLHQLSQGVNLDCYYPQDIGPWKQAFYTRHDLNGKKLVVYTAHLNVASDLDAIYEIIRQAHVQLPLLRFLVIGGGPMEKYFKDLARSMDVDAISLFTGYLPPSEVVKHLLLGDVAIVFYKDVPVNLYRESMKLREMLALGLRVVCNDVGDLRTFSPYTYQVQTSYAACAQQLVQVLTKGGDGREKQGMEYVRKMMDWDQIGQGLYERIMRDIPQ